MKNKENISQLTEWIFDILEAIFWWAIALLLLFIYLGILSIQIIYEVIKALWKIAIVVLAIYLIGCYFNFWECLLWESELAKQFKFYK